MYIEIMTPNETAITTSIDLGERAMVSLEFTLKMPTLDEMCSETICYYY